MSANVQHVKVLEADSSIKMTELINAAYKDGYVIHGNMTAIHTPTWNKLCLFQTMVKYFQYRTIGGGPR